MFPTGLFSGHLSRSLQSLRAQHQRDGAGPLVCERGEGDMRRLRDARSRRTSGRLHRGSDAELRRPDNTAEGLFRAGVQVRVGRDIGLNATVTRIY